MQLKEAIAIIEFTNTDTLSKALEKFDKHGVISDELLPFLTVIIDKAPNQLLEKLQQIGFKGDIQLTKSLDNELEIQYVIFDSKRHNLDSAVLTLKQKF